MYFYIKVSDPSIARTLLHWMDLRQFSFGDEDELNMIHGKGTWLFGGWEYHGQWQHGTPTGQGTLLYRKQGRLVFTYTGGVDELCQHGYGKQQWHGADGSIVATYEGEWKRGIIVDETKWKATPQFFDELQKLSQQEQFIFGAALSQKGIPIQKP